MLYTYIHYTCTQHIITYTTYPQHLHHTYMHTHIPRMHAHISNIPQSHHNSCTPHTLLMHTHYTYLYGPHIPTQLLHGFWVSVAHSLCLLSHCSLLAQASSLAMDSSPPDYCTSHFTFSVFRFQWAWLLDPEGAFRREVPCPLSSHRDSVAGRPSCIIGKPVRTYLSSACITAPSPELRARQPVQPVPRCAQSSETHGSL